MQVCNDEGSHVALLSGALGPNATQACTYDFPYTDPTSFVARRSTSLQLFSAELDAHVKP